MTSYLNKANIEIEIYRYDAKAKDDLYDKTKVWLLSQDIEQISKSTKLRKDYIVKVINAMQSPYIFQLNQLAQIDGVGIKTLEKIFKFAQCSLVNNADEKNKQLSLFNNL